MLGRHYLAITNPEHLTGKFNSHLQEAVAVLADECFFAGDRRHEQMLKTLITGDSIIIEPKGVNSYAARNHIHLIMSTNQDWAVPASEDVGGTFTDIVLALPDGRIYGNKTTTTPVDPGA